MAESFGSAIIDTATRAIRSPRIRSASVAISVSSRSQVTGEVHARPPTTGSLCQTAVVNWVTRQVLQLRGSYGMAPSRALGS